MTMLESVTDGSAHIYFSCHGSVQNDLVKSLDAEQQDMHTPDPPWEMRSSPPSDWNR